MGMNYTWVWQNLLHVCKKINYLHFLEKWSLSLQQSVAGATMQVTSDTLRSKVFASKTITQFSKRCKPRLEQYNYLQP
jgi:hypothetical protein